MKLTDALFNWLQIKTVAEARPDDRAALETLAFFEEILREDHQLTRFEVTRTDDTMYYVRYEGADGSRKSQMFEREAVEQLLSDIRANPKYNE